MRGQDIKIKAPEEDGAVNQVWRPVAELIERDDRTWTIKPDGLAKFVTSDASVAIVFATTTLTLCISGAAGTVVVPVIQPPTVS